MIKFSIHNLNYSNKKVDDQNLIHFNLIRLEKCDLCRKLIDMSNKIVHLF